MKQKITFAILPLCFTFFLLAQFITPGANIFFYPIHVALILIITLGFIIYNSLALYWPEHEIGSAGFAPWLPGADKFNQDPKQLARILNRKGYGAGIRLSIQENSLV